MRRASPFAWVALALAIAGCRPKTETPVTEPRTRGDTHTPVAQPPEIVDFTATAEAACAQLRDGLYRCWGTHSAFPVMLGVADADHSGTVIELPTLLPGALAKVQRLVLTDSDAWAVTDGGELLAWTENDSGFGKFARRDTPRIEAWKPALGGDIRDVVATDSSVCVRRGADIVCWEAGLSGVGKRTFDSKGVVTRSADGGPPPIGRLQSTDRGLWIETESACRSLDEFDPGRSEDDGRDVEPIPGRCGALDRERLAEIGLPPGVTAIKRGSCVLVENVRLWCEGSNALEGRVGSAWELVPRLVAKSGASTLRDRADCIASGASIDCHGKRYPLPSGTVKHVLSSGNNRDGARGTWVIASDGVVYATDDAPKLVRLGSAKPPVQVVGHRDRTCRVDAAGTLACQHWREPYARVRGLPKIERLWTARDGWIARDSKGTLWSITMTQKQDAEDAVVRVRDVGTGEPLLLLDNGMLVRETSGSMHVVGEEGVLTPLAADDPLARMIATDVWIQLAGTGELVCGRNAEGNVGCALVGEIPSTAPIGIERNPTLFRPPLTFAAVDLFEGDDGMCAASSDGAVACWGPKQQRDRGGWVDVTDRLLPP